MCVCVCVCACVCSLLTAVWCALGNGEMENCTPYLATFLSFNLTSCKAKRCMLVRNKSCIKAFSLQTITAGQHFHNNASSSEKVHLLLSLISESTHVSVLELFCLICADFSPEFRPNTFHWEGSVIMDYELVF